MSAEDEEGPRDPGADQPNYQGFTEHDFQGHRAHSIYVGVHLPGRRRHHRRHHRHHHSRNSAHEQNSQEQPTLPVTPPGQRVQFILGESVTEDPERCSHPLFSEMEELVLGEGDVPEWKETARWIKFEEDVEVGGDRWSKPHVATLSLHSLFELRSLILNGTVLLDMEADSLEQVADIFIDTTNLTTEIKEKVREALMRKHRHQHEKRKENISSRLPIIRSLAEIGKNHSSSKMEEGPAAKPENSGRFLGVPLTAGGGQQLEAGQLHHSYSSASMSRNQSSSDLNQDHKGNLHFMRKVPAGAEASNILVGEVDFLNRALSAFVRLRKPVFFADLTEVPVPTRFLFLLLGPSGGTSSFHEIGRAMATLMSDEVFHEVAYRAESRTHLLSALDEFLDAVTVLPPGEWDPAIRIEPPAAIPSQEMRRRPPEKKEEVDPEREEARLREEAGLSMTGRPFGGLINDIKRKSSWYLSDFKDAFAVQCVASWIFLYFACLSPIITFGGLLSEATGKNMAAMESLVSGCVCGLGYGLFSGQPLTILGSTGPVLVFETIVFEFCQERGWDYMSFRLWVGFWTALLLIILVVIDASALVCYITRFTEENFACLIAFIFIIKASENLLQIRKKYPLNTHGTSNLSLCECMPLGSNYSTASLEKCLDEEGIFIGKGCPLAYSPDVFLMSLLLFFGTFLISIQLKGFKNALFFPSKVRQFISDFAVIIAILSMTILDAKMGIPTPKLEVPSEFKPTLPNRGWIISPFKNPVWTIPLAGLPAILATILIFMDQQITAVIINRKENKLKKGCGYHLDLFVLAILIVFCSIMGLPWFVAATVLSINHVNSLKLESECAAPGEKPQFLGVREQRVTHLLIFITIGLSVLFTPLLRNIPMPVLFGVFLYMGVSSLKGLQFFDRIMIMLMPAKYQPDFMFLRQVPLKRVHLFTVIQLVCLILLWLIKSFSQTSILFPLMLVVMIGMRKALDFVFTQRELKILDDVMPETMKREEDLEELGGLEEQNFQRNENLQIPLANGNVIKIPFTSINISEEMNKTDIWKQVNNEKQEKRKNPGTSIKLQLIRVKRSISYPPYIQGYKKARIIRTRKDKLQLRAIRRGTKKDAVNEEEKARLSAMEEEEENDYPIMIKIDSEECRIRPKTLSGIGGTQV